ncbi:MAG: 5-(carboxyamino)imidazole ribonucleotide synthase [Rhodobacteraceae bacterium]|nr:5-(carboxyamino)imidazole ribonucleotide synthase [Paracoccaceae bacterium]
MTLGDKVAPPGGTLGILGGGQLGRMLAIAAARLGLKAHIYAPPGDNPAFEVAASHTTASYTDADALSAFAQTCDVVTLEFENLPLTALEICSGHAPVRPGARALAVTQDRVEEKRFLREAGVDTVDFWAISELLALPEALSDLGGRGILKTRRFGYDGKGQARINDPSEIDAAWSDLNGAPAILEAFAPFTRELSVIVARGLGGEIVCFDPAENRHDQGILRVSRVPGDISQAGAAQAVAIARRIVEALDYIGVMGVEFFELEGGALLVNELAPRVHNSGHWTIEACVVDQFEQHVRAVCGWPLGEPARHSAAEMSNLLGDEVNAWRDLASDPRAAVHLYGKAEARPGRKMGHVTRLLRG